MSSVPGTCSDSEFHAITACVNARICCLKLSFGTGRSSCASANPPLTDVYLRDELQNRRFDTVILDEASMAPIPGLWIAARLAEANLVVVRDGGQLPPIKRSAHPLANKWLGQQILDARRLRATSYHSNPPPYFIQLTADEQTTGKL